MSYDADSLREQQGVSVRSGFPNPATDASLHTIDLNKILITHTASTYLFRVRGHEWEGAGVFDGDVAIVDRGLDPRPGDIVMWWGDSPDEFRISTYRQVGQGATVWGVITATIHQFRSTLHIPAIRPPRGSHER